MKKFYLLSILFLLCCCRKQTDIYPVLSKDDACASAQQKLETLQCKANDGHVLSRTKRGVEFKDFCSERINQGTYTLQQISCLTTITDCKDVDLCLEVGE